jgi:hypothetical protein
VNNSVDTLQKKIHTPENEKINHLIANTSHGVLRQSVHQCDNLVRGRERADDLPPEQPIGPGHDQAGIRDLCLRVPAIARRLIHRTRPRTVIP